MWSPQCIVVDRQRITVLRTLEIATKTSIDDLIDAEIYLSNIMLSKQNMNFSYYHQLFPIFCSILKILSFRYYYVTRTMNRLNILKNHIATNSEKPLKGKTVVITGGSRGIGLAIGRACAKDGANVALLAKTTEPHPKLPGTLYTAAKEIEDAGGKALPLKCDIRNEKNVEECINKVVQKFGSIDILINNASAISLTGTLETQMKKYELMHHINTRGTFLVSKICLPHLLKAQNPHILNISPPLNMEKRWFSNHVAYTMAKYGMSMCVLGMAEEFKDQGVAVNALWPRTAIATAAVKNHLGGDQSIRKSRTEQIMADSAYIILKSPSKATTGNFFIDDEVLRKNGVTDLKKYQVDQSLKQQELLADFFL